MKKFFKMLLTGFLEEISMKKATSLLLIICFLISFSACNIKNDIEDRNSEKQFDTEKQVDTEKQESTEKEKPSDDTDDSNSLDNIEPDTDYDEIRNEVECIYMTLEEVIPSATDIVKARYLRATMDNHMRCYYEFEVTESLRGLGLEETITVGVLVADCYIPDRDISFSTYSSRYEQGKEYLLLLQRWTSVYDDEYIFGFVSDSLVIPIGEDGKGYLASGESLMYGSDLSNHLGSTEIADSFEKGTFEQYAVNVVKDNVMVHGKDYIESTDISEILHGSEYVLEVEIKNVDSEYISDNRITCRCEIVSVIKGAFTEVATSVTFPAGPIEVGDTYIIAVNTSSGSQRYLVMSSKNSVYSIDQKEEIIAILSDQ